MRRLVMERLCLMLGSALVLAAVCLYVYDRSRMQGQALRPLRR